MRRFVLGVVLFGSGLLSLVFIAFASPLCAVMRTDRRVRAARERELEALGYDDNDLGIDVDAEYCEHMLTGAPGSCARCEGT